MLLRDHIKGQTVFNVRVPRGRIENGAAEGKFQSRLYGVLAEYKDENIKGTQCNIFIAGVWWGGTNKLKATCLFFSTNFICSNHELCKILNWSVGVAIRLLHNASKYKMWGTLIVFVFIKLRVSFIKLWGNDPTRAVFCRVQEVGRAPKSVCSVGIRSPIFEPYLKLYVILPVSYQLS